MDNALGFTPLQASSLTPYLTVATATGEYYSKTQMQTILGRMYSDIVGAVNAQAPTATKASDYWLGNGGTWTAV